MRLHPPHSTQGSIDSASTPEGATSSNALRPQGTLEQRVRLVIDLIRPAVQADGGDIEFVGITDAPERYVEIRMHGACVGCPSSAVTLQTGIERNLRVHVPEVRGVRSVD